MPVSGFDYDKLNALEVRTLAILDAFSDDKDMGFNEYDWHNGVAQGCHNVVQIGKAQCFCCDENGDHC